MKSEYFAVAALSVIIFTFSTTVSGQVQSWEQLIDAGKKARSQGQYAESAKALEAALRESEKNGGGDLRVATSLRELALTYTSDKKYAEAEPLFQRALSICEKTLGHDHPEVANIWFDMANSYRVQRRPADSEHAFKTALAIQEKTFGPNSAEVGATLTALAGRLREQRKFAEAEPLLQRALAIREKVLKPDDLALVNTLFGFAAFYTEQEKYAQAEPLLRRSIEILEKRQAYGTGYPNLPDGLTRYAGVLRKTNRSAEAEKIEARAKTIRAEHP